MYTSSLSLIYTLAHLCSIGDCDRRWHPGSYTAGGGWVIRQGESDQLGSELPHPRTHLWGPAESDWEDLRVQDYISFYMCNMYRYLQENLPHNTCQCDVKLHSKHVKMTLEYRIFHLESAGNCPSYRDQWPKVGKSDGNNPLLSKQKSDILGSFYILRMKISINLTCIMGKILLLKK